MKKNSAALENKKGLIAWCLYDWANSVFPVIVTTFVFSTYFAKNIAPNPIVGMSQWGKAIGLASFFVAILGPILGSIADYAGSRKPWLGILTIAAILSCGLLWFAKPHVSATFITLLAVVISTTCVELGNVFYNAMLGDLVPKKYIGRLSGWSWGAGYFGGLTGLAIALFVFIENHLHIIPSNTSALGVRLCGPFIAVWFAAFAWPLFIYTPDKPRTNLSLSAATTKGLKSLFTLLKTLGKHREIFKFLVARIFYIDGLNTLFAFGGIYAAGTFGMPINDVLLFGIASNLAAGIGAIAFAWFDDWIGSKPTILISIVILLTGGIAILLVHQVKYFWAFGLLLSIAVGPLQAASRSMMVHLSPEAIRTELFGLYAFSGKATAFVGPWLVSFVTALMNSQRWGMSTVMVLLIIGGLLLLSVKPITTTENNTHKVK